MEEQLIDDAVAPMQDTGQALRIKLVNRTNVCYLNSAALSIHWAGLLSGQSRESCFGRLQAPMRALSQYSSSAPFDIASSFLWRAALSGWGRLHSQQDAAEMLQHLLAFARPPAYHGAWQARIGTEAAPEIQESGLLTDLLSVPIAGSTLQGTIDSWGTGDCVRALVGRPPALLVLHLARFAEDGTKDSRRLQLSPGDQIAVPFFSDSGTDVIMRSYRIASLVMHLGPTPRSGHYQSVHSERTAGRWRFCLLDDNKLPRMLKASEQDLISDNVYLIFLFRRELA